MLFANTHKFIHEARRLPPVIYDLQITYHKDQIHRKMISYGYRCSGNVKEKGTGAHPVDSVCIQNDIKHTLTRIRRPQTNGMVERFNRRVNEAIAQKIKINKNSGKNSFYSPEDRNTFLYNFIDGYNKTRLRCLNYQSPINMLNSN